MLYSKVHDHIWCVLAYLSDEKWENLPLPPSGIELGDVFSFELVRDSDFQGLSEVWCLCLVLSVSRKKVL